MLGTLVTSENEVNNGSCFPEAHIKVSYMYEEIHNLSGKFFKEN